MRPNHRLQLMPLAELAAQLSPTLAVLNNMTNKSSITFSDIIFRDLDYSNKIEVSNFMQLFWSVPFSLGDEYIPKQSNDFIEDYISKAIESENESNTFSGIAFHNSKIVGIHVLRKFTEFDSVGAHIANLWVHEDYRKLGVATELKKRGESWAISIGANFINTNVLPKNDMMLDMNTNSGFTPYKVNMRKRISS